MTYQVDSEYRRTSYRGSPLRPVGAAAALLLAAVLLGGCYSTSYSLHSSSYRHAGGGLHHEPYYSYSHSGYGHYDYGHYNYGHYGYGSHYSHSGYGYYGGGGRHGGGHR